MALFSAGSSLTYNLAPFVLNVITTSRLLILHLSGVPQGSVLYSWSCTLPLSVLSLSFHYVFADDAALLLFPPTES